MKVVFSLHPPTLSMRDALRGLIKTGSKNLIFWDLFSRSRQTLLHCQIHFSVHENAKCWEQRVCYLTWSVYLDDVHGVMQNVPQMWPITALTRMTQRNCQTVFLRPPLAPFSTW